MKKVFYILLSLFMFVLSTGFTLTRHYCSSELVSMAVDSVPKACCEAGNCCHNEATFIHLEEDFVAPASPEGQQVLGLDLLFDAVSVSVTIESIALTNLLVIIPKSPPPPELHTTLALLQAYLC
ncbi:MAG: hypothetical protein KKD74_11010 [Bacteroidetes bacterium]|nr:hypothetical protein [Bacteroidota bacterium]